MSAMGHKPPISPEVGASLCMVSRPLSVHVLAEAHATSYPAGVQVHLIDTSLYRSGVILLYPGPLGEANVVNLRQPTADPSGVHRKLRARSWRQKKRECALLPGGVAQYVGTDRLALAGIAHVHGGDVREAPPRVQ